MASQGTISTASAPAVPGGPSVISAAISAPPFVPAASGAAAPSIKGLALSAQPFVPGGKPVEAPSGSTGHTQPGSKGRGGHGNESGPNASNSMYAVPTGAQPFQPSQARASHSSPPAQHRANQGQSHGHGPNNSRSMCDRGMHIYGSNQAHNMQPVAPHPGAVPVSHLSASALGSHHTSNARSTTPSRGPMNPSQAQEAHQLGVGRAGTGRLFVGEPLRQQLAAAAFAAQAQWTGSSPDKPMLPERLGIYHTLYPLEGVPGASNAPDSYSHALGLRTFVLKGISNRDGIAYALRRVDGKGVPPNSDLLAAANSAVETWAPLSSHPNLVGLRHAFISADMDATPSLVLAYDFHAGSTTMAATYLSPTAGANGVVAMHPLQEHQLWSILVQLGSAVRAVHNAGLALRPTCLHPSKVLVTPQGRLRVNCCGLVDALAGDPTLEREDLYYAHRQDLTAIGQLVLALACIGLMPPHHPGSMDVLLAACQPTSPMGGRCSRELCRVLGALLASAEGGPLGSARQLCSAVAEHSMQELEASALAQDMLLAELSKECENGRLMRLLIKLGFVVERPEGDVDGSWAETGDRYLLKLFRDFVFHQRAPEGHAAAGGPLLDWGLVTEALNKLDAGVPERMLLLARDESAMLVASYSDLKRCVDASYTELQAKATTAVQQNRQQNNA